MTETGNIAQSSGPIEAALIEIREQINASNTRLTAISAKMRVTLDSLNGTRPAEACGDTPKMPDEQPCALAGLRTETQRLADLCNLLEQEEARL